MPDLQVLPLPSPPPPPTAVAGSPGYHVTCTDDCADFNWLIQVGVSGGGGGGGKITVIHGFDTMTIAITKYLLAID